MVYAYKTPLRGLLGVPRTLVGAIACLSRLENEGTIAWCLTWCHNEGMRFKPGFAVRRAFDSEKALLKRTARSLATRFETRPRWIEEILNSTIHKHETIANYREEYKESESVLSDRDLKNFFSPNLIEPLSVLGANGTIALFQVDASKLEELDLGEFVRTGSDQRVLEKRELEQHKLIRENVGLYKILLETVPPPIMLSAPDELGDDEDSDDYQDTDLVDLLREFSKHLLSQRDAMVYYDGKAEMPFKPFPWFDRAFSTGAPVIEVGLTKGKLAKYSYSSKVNSEDERKQNSRLKQPELIIEEPGESRKKFRSSIVNNGSHGYADRKSLYLGKPIEHIRNREVSVRELLFEVRIQTINIIADYIEGKPSREPVDELASLIADRFSREQFQALIGEKPAYFFLPLDKKYRHKDYAVFHKLLRMACILPAVYDSRLIRLFYKSAEPIHNLSKKVKGPHILKLSYFDAVKILGTPKADVVANAFDEIYEKFNSLELRAFDALRRLFRIDAPTTVDSKTQSSLNSITEDLSERSNVVIPYLKELLSPEVTKNSSKKIGAFFDNFREFRPFNKKLDPIRFTKAQARVMEVLFVAQAEHADGCLKRLTLVDKIYAPEEARRIRMKDGTKVIKQNKKESKFPYEWRLEKTILKNSHPAWRLGLIEHGKKIGDEKTYRLNLDFELNTKT